jgi:amino acid transporter
LSASGEVIRPARTIPRALALALGSVTLLYMAVQTVAQGILGPSLSASKAPLADAMARLSPALQLLMLGGAAVSMVGWLAGDITATPRMLFAFGRDGRLPGIVGRLHPRSHAPHVAIIGYALMAATLAVTGTFAELAVMATLASAALYVVGCAAAWQLAQRGVALAGEPLNFRWLGSAMIVGAGSMLLLIGLASPKEIVGLLMLVGISVSIYAIQQRLSGRFRTLDHERSAGDL